MKSSVSQRRWQYLADDFLSNSTQGETGEAEFKRSFITAKLMSLS